MAELQLKTMGVQEFLDWQLRQDKLYELVDGISRLPMKSQAGASSNHDTVTVNIIASLHAQLRGSPCRPLTDDIAVQIPAGNIRRPDLLVECGKPGPKDMIAAEPRIVFEVLSPSTMEFDRTRKVEEYKTVASITTILVIDTQVPQVTVHRRSGNNWSAVTIIDLDAVLEFTDIKASLPLRDLYEDVALQTR